MPHFMIVLILYTRINILNFSWIKKCLSLRNREPLRGNELYRPKASVQILIYSTSMYLCCASIGVEIKNCLNQL